MRTVSIATRRLRQTPQRRPPTEAFDGTEDRIPPRPARTRVADVAGCDIRNRSRDLDDVIYRSGTRDCVVQSGILHAGTTIRRQSSNPLALVRDNPLFHGF